MRALSQIERYFSLHLCDRSLTVRHILQDYPPEVVAVLCNRGIFECQPVLAMRRCVEAQGPFISVNTLGTKENPRLTQTHRFAFVLVCNKRNICFEI
jgi:hypothetical protein